MAGNSTVPVVLIGRYTTFAGATTFYTTPINVTGYEKIEAQAWRGKMIATATFSVEMYASLDQQTWVPLAGGDPGQETEATYTSDLTLPWLRVKIVLGDTAGDYPTATCYLIGLLIKRLFGL